jgi:hypothetical protein
MLHVNVIFLVLRLSAICNDAYNIEKGYALKELIVII